MRIKDISKYHCFFHSVELGDNNEKKMTIDSEIADREKVRKFKKKTTENESNLWKQDLKSSLKSSFPGVVRS